MDVSEGRIAILEALINTKRQTIGLLQKKVEISREIVDQRKKELSLVRAKSVLMAVSDGR